MSDDSEHFDHFDRHIVSVGDVDIHCRIGGSGPPLLLLHGCPQTHVMWRKIAPHLARSYTVITPDLRGYGDSSKPQGFADHSNYSFRAMAADQIAVMASLGFDRFDAIGHDRGARVLHRMALDRPGVLQKICLLDILPTQFLYAQTDRLFASAYWEWFFFIQRDGFPETILSSNPAAFLRYEIGELVDTGVISQAAWTEYLRVLSSRDAMHGMCEDYRAGASIDLEHDAVDAGRRIDHPMLVLWGERNPVWSRFDMIDVWRRYASNVRGSALPAGHYLAEETPGLVLAQIEAFLGEAPLTA